MSVDEVQEVIRVEIEGVDGVQLIRRENRIENFEVVSFFFGPPGGREVFVCLLILLVYLRGPLYIYIYYGTYSRLYRRAFGCRRRAGKDHRQAGECEGEGCY